MTQFFPESMLNEPGIEPMPSLKVVGRKVFLGLVTKVVLLKLCAERTGELSSRLSTSVNSASLMKVSSLFFSLNVYVLYLKYSLISIYLRDLSPTSV